LVNLWFEARARRSPLAEALGEQGGAKFSSTIPSQPFDRIWSCDPITSAVGIEIYWTHSLLELAMDLL
jgi:hypothetical protein